MKLIVDMPYSEIMQTSNDNPRGLAKLEKLLTINIKKYVSGSDTEIEKVCLLEERRKFRTGLLTRIKMLAPTVGLPVESVHYVEKHPPIAPLAALASAKLSLRDYQQEAVDQVLAHKMGVVCVATGGGKTHIAAAMIARKAVPTIFLVHTKELLWQTKARFEEVFKAKIGVIGDGVFEPEDVTIATIQTLSNQPANLGRKIRMVIQDETHHIPADTFYYVTSKFDAEFVYGLSATPYRKDGADLMIEAAAGPIVVQITPSDLIERKWLVQPVFWPIPVPGATSYAPLPRHTIIRRYLVENDARNKMISKFARFFSGMGQTVLIAVNQVKHAKIILEQLERDGCHAAEIMDGSMHSTARKKLLDRLQAKKLRVIISTLMKEGVDVPSLNCLIIGDGGSDSMQLVGRVLRKDKDKETATIIDFMDHGHVTLLKNSQARLAKYKQERAFLIMSGTPI